MACGTGSKSVSQTVSCAWGNLYLDLDSDALWFRCLADNFEEYWRVASKITPTTTPTRSSSPPPPSSASMHTRPPSADPGSNGGPDRDGAYTVRSVPVRVHLPDGPVLQDLAPPVLEDGTYLHVQPICHNACGLTMESTTVGSYHTLHHFLSTLLPLLFPPSVPPVPSSSPDAPVPVPAVPSPPPAPLAYALIQGVVAPLESELGWLGACMTGADGWVNVCIGLTKDAPKL